MKRTILFLQILVVVLCLFFGSARAIIHVDPDSQLYVDEYGRTRMFHGVNVVYKVFPFYPPELNVFHSNNSLCDEDMVNLIDKWGLNVIRLHVAWQGTETPYPGSFNQTYLDVLKTIVSKLRSHGIYVILDAHQDVMSPKFCGEGFPDWAAIPSKEQFPEPVYRPSNFHFDPVTGYPLISDCLKHAFSTYYLSFAASAAFQNFYDNLNGIQDEFVKFWALVAQNFNGFDNLLGYEIINEPWPGNVYADPLLLLVSGHGDKKNLAPLYEKVYKGLRKYDSSHIVFYEPAVTDYYQIGFQSGPGGKSDNHKQALSYHVYCGVVNKTGDPRSRILCNAVDDIFFDSRIKEIKKIGGGSFLTEFGALDNATTGATEINYITDKADKYLTSWTYWQFKYYSDITTAANPGTSESFYDNYGNLQSQKVKALSRTYAQAICGSPDAMTFNPKTGGFQLSFRYIGTCQDQPTIIFLNQEYYYPKGFSVSINPPNALKVTQPQPNYLHFSFTPQFLQQVQNNPKDATKIQINIDPK